MTRSKAAAPPTPRPRPLREADAATVQRLVGAAADLALVVDGDGRGPRGHRRTTANCCRRSRATGAASVDRDRHRRERDQGRRAAARRARRAGGRRRWRHVNHRSRPTADLPVLYTASRCRRRPRPARTRVVALGRDLRATMALQRRLVRRSSRWSATTRATARPRRVSQAVPDFARADAGRRRHHPKMPEANAAAMALFGHGRRRPRRAGPARGLRARAPRPACRRCSPVPAAGPAPAAGGCALRRAQPGIGGARHLPSAGPGSRLHDRAARRRWPRSRARAAAEPPRRRPWAGHRRRSVADGTRTRCWPRSCAHSADALVVHRHRTGASSTSTAPSPSWRSCRARSRRSDEPLDRWLGRPGVEVDVLIANLRDLGPVGLYATELRGEFGGEAEVEVSASRLEGAGGAVYSPSRCATSVVACSPEGSGPAPQIAGLGAPAHRAGRARAAEADRLRDQRPHRAALDPGGAESSAATTARSRRSCSGCRARACTSSCAATAWARSRSTPRSDRPTLRRSDHPSGHMKVSTTIDV